MAPFIKKRALDRLLDVCDENVTIEVIGRFLPEDIAAGVSDIEAAEFILNMSTAVLKTHPLLHAKLYRGDNQCLVGSANVTGRGLGWAAVPNEELLISTRRSRMLREFEDRLVADANEMTWARLRELRARVRELPSVDTGRLNNLPSECDEFWLPTCRTPRYLFDVYSNSDQWRLLKSAREAARRDIEIFQPLPDNLDRATFESIVRGGLRRHPLCRWLMDQQEVLDQEVLALKIQPAATNQELPLKAKLLWEVFQEWLLYFLPNEFRMVPSETKLVYAKQL